MTIKELLPETQYDGIVFFLNEHGYTSPLDLSDFDYDELYFVPGVSDQAVEKCRDILTAYMNLQKSGEDPVPQEKELAVAENQKSHNNSNRSIVDDDLSAAILDLTAHVSAAIEAVESRERLDQFRAAFIGTSTLNDQHDYELFSMLCDEIDALLPASIEKADDTEQYSPEEYELLSAVSVEDVFVGAPRGSAMIRFCRENNIKTLADLGKINFSDIKAKGLGVDSLRNCRKVYIAKREAVLTGETSVPEPEKTPQEWFVESFGKLKERDRDCLIARSQGLTLQATGEHFGITRERVRQIVAKAVRRLSRPCEAVFSIVAAGRLSINTPEIKTLFSDQAQIDVISYVLENTSSVRFFPFADKYVVAEAVPEEWNEKLLQIAKDIIGDSINYFDNLELIDERLSSEGLSFIDSIDYMGYLLEHGYKALGDYVVKKSQAYRNICLDVIRRHFCDGIKLDSDENNADMALLRSIVRREFGEAGLPDSNRALTARVSPALILCGRGKYISPENVVIDIPLVEQIVDYISESSETSLYYSEIFTAFSGRLLAQTDIDNANYLHGVLKMFYPDEFNYERDLLVKKGMERNPFENRLAQLLKDNHQAMSKAEIQSKMLGVTDIRIVNALVRLPELIQWDYNEYNHIDNLHIGDGDTAALKLLLQDLTEKQSGYCSENGLFGAVLKEMPEFISKNAIHNSHNLFYVAGYLFGDTYRFSRPHIAAPSFPNIELTNANIARFFIGHAERLLYPDLVRMSQRAGWSNGTFTLVLNAVEQDYCRISLNEYVLRSDFRIDEETLSKIARVVSDLMSASGYYGIFSIYNYDQFPPAPYEWNEFLLQTVLEVYALGFTILEPNTKDRRYKRGIIVPDSCSCRSFEELVIDQMKADHIHSVPEDEFSSYLRRKGLVLTSNIPQELFDGEGVRLEKGAFVYE